MYLSDANFNFPRKSLYRVACRGICTLAQVPFVRKGAPHETIPRFTLGLITEKRNGSSYSFLGDNARELYNFSYNSTYYNRR